MNAPYLFHGHDVSYFSGKVRPALPQKNLWYREVLPDIREIIRRTGLNYFPVLVTPEDELWQDTSDILDHLEERHPEPPLYPPTPVQRVVSYLVEVYGDEIGLLAGMHYRWSFEESVNKAVVDFSTPIGKPEKGRKFADKMGGTLPAMGIHPGTTPAIEEHTRALLDALCAHFETNRYLLGDSMSLADCGLMGPLYGHLFRDAVPQKLLYETAFHVCAWVERMNRPPLDQSGWAANDELPDTLVAALTTMADGVPFIVGAVEAVDAWAAENDLSEPPPGIVGAIRAPYRNATLETVARPYTMWMVQRPLDAYRALDDGQRTAVDSALAGTGWEPLLALRPKHRLTKRDYHLAWAQD